MTPRRLPLVLLPTPLHRLDRLSEDLHLDLWIKRDDLTGFAGGGNKGRKLEYLIADAVEAGAEVVVTCGALQSNFIRQLGAACAMVGIGCEAAVMATPFDLAAGKPNPALDTEGGNVILDHLFGAQLHRYADDDWLVLYDHMEQLAKRLEAEGRRVYRISVGGSSPLGAYSFYQAAKELPSDPPFDWIVFASSSGSTHIGLAYAFAGSATKVLGMCSDPEPEIVEEFAENGKGLAALLGIAPLAASDFRMSFDYVGEGYAAPFAPAMDAIRTVGRREGILLDPVYTGKAFAGLLDLAKKGVLGGRVLFWHTGGTPNLFACRETP